MASSSCGNSGSGPVAAPFQSSSSRPRTSLRRITSGSTETWIASSRKAASARSSCWPKCVTCSPHTPPVSSNPWNRYPESIMSKILLVEDNELNRDMLSRRLERRGYTIVMALDGQQAVEMAVSEGPTLILMDMSLPVLDGWEATRRIKADERTRNIPILALTAHAMDGDEQKAKTAGCDDYDTKPVEFTRLLGKMEALLASKFTA